MLGFLDLDAGDLKGHELQHGEISKMFNKKSRVSAHVLYAIVLVHIVLHGC